MTQLQQEYDVLEMIGDDIGRQHTGEINRKWDFFRMILTEISLQVIKHIWN